MMLKRASGELANGLVPDMSIVSAYANFNLKNQGFHKLYEWKRKIK
jgi:hypothetical protein